VLAVAVMVAALVVVTIVIIRLHHDDLLGRTVRVANAHLVVNLMRHLHTMKVFQIRWQSLIECFKAEVS